MRDLFRLIGWTVVDLFRSRAALEAEIWTLRQQINVLRRTAPKRLSFSVFDHLVFVGLYRLFPKICDALAIVKPDTIVRWHRAGFRLYWCWRSRRRGGRLTVPLEIRKLIQAQQAQLPQVRVVDAAFFQRQFAADHLIARGGIPLELNAPNVELFAFINVNLQVAPALVANDDRFSMASDSSLVVSAASLLANDVSADHQPLTVTAVTSPDE